MRKPKILFVDDEDARRDSFLRMMRGRGHTVELAAGAPDAIRKSACHPYSVVITDLRLAGMDGLSLVRRLQTIHPATSFIVATSVPGLDLERDFETEGNITAIVPKPWDDEAIVRSIEEAERLASLRSEREPGPEPWLERPKAGWPRRVLLLEDDPADVEIVQELLSEFVTRGLKIEHASRLSRALEHVHDEDFDFVLSDLSLPDADGLDAVLTLRGAAPGVPIIVMSGHDDERVALEALQMGAQDYLVKGEFDRRTLYRAVRYTMERHRADQRLVNLALYDQLTGLANRTMFRDRLDQAIARSRRRDETFAMMFLDLDHFRSVNDSIGHEAADGILQEVASRLRTTLRETDTVARLGGDEFAVILDAPSGQHEAKLAADRILRALGEPVHLDGEDLVVTASIGAAAFPGAGGSAEALLRSADSAMVLAKDRGRNKAELAVHSEFMGGLKRVCLADSLRRSFEHDDFVLHYQPQIDLSSKRVVGLEALLRWQRPQEGLVGPTEFLSTLEETGLIVDVGKWVLNCALKQVKTWRDESGEGVRVSVNFSARQFEDAALLGTVEDSLMREDLDPSSLEVEITESLLMRDTEQTKQTLSGLKELGVRIAIDDFGTGYSSLAYLTQFSVDVLKVDRSFVKTLGIPGSKEHQIASAIVGLGHSLGLEVVAEGIETAEQLSELERTGCDIGQGFYLGTPNRTWYPATNEGGACGGWAAA